MPSYISHAIMGEQLYNEIYTNNLCYKIPLLKDELKGYSLGIDLSILSKRVKSDPANSLTKDFFISMIKYIKEHKLTENISIISLLYGHIAHYFLDVNTHPLIYYIDAGSQKTGLISNHNLIEGYINSYLTKKILNKDIMDITPEYFDQIDLKKPEVVTLLNHTYGSVYNDYQIIKSYKLVMSLFKLIETTIKKHKIPKEKLIKFSKFKTFLHKNNLTLGEMTNEDNAIYTNPVTGEKHNEKLIDLYYKAIDMTIEAIKKVNKCLYSNYPITTLDNVFTGLSYDTGIDCNLGRDMIYVRKRKKIIERLQK